MITTMTQKGQVTIPISIRRNLHLEPGDKVIFSQVNGEVRVKPVLDVDSLMGSVKSNRRFSQKLLRAEDAVIGRYLAKEYLEKEKRIREQK